MKFGVVYLTTRLMYGSNEQQNKKEEKSHGIRYIKGKCFCLLNDIDNVLLQRIFNKLAFDRLSFKEMKKECYSHLK